MSRIILIFGTIAGLVVAVPMCLLVANSEPGSAATSHVTGYLIMLVALSLVFVGVKRLRDRDLGGVIRFVPAMLAGLGISAVAGVAVAAKMDELREQYVNPLFRLPAPFIEIFPVGLLVSLISASLLRNSRFLPARAHP